ncbi:breast cancer type 1 susceptibility protein [Microcaecilia unicolor]|uniref:RING-type E3 ubiquitin transferase n=1 Tax=Microcaecilia unicolor TaxID=1415580 RepID=A0A6P7ZV37_9AMPH|nr:breast cancer type 1 susceptibility protein [Microcaecilia unicolor]
MAFPSLETEEVHKVLAVMQKNLECPICLELMKEPVSTKCDHLFCRFCMLKLLSKKRRGLAECPMCKNEVTRRSIKESPRFKLLIEGLLKTIQAFEMDTGFKFSSSQERTEKQAESSASEQLNTDGDTVHSRGYRLPRKGVQEHGQGKKPGLETNSDVQHSGNLASRRSQRIKRQKRDASEPLCIDFGLDSSSEDLLEKAGSIGSCEVEESLQTEPESKECWADWKCDRKESDRLSCMPDAEVPSPAKSDFAKTNFEDPGRIPSHVGNIEAVPLKLSEEIPRENDSRASDSQVEQCESSANPSSLQNDAESFTCHAKGASPAQNIQLEKNYKWPKLDQRSKQELSQDTKIYNNMWDTQEEHIDDLYDKESPYIETQLLPEISESNTCPISRKRVKRSLQRVNEWLSKNSEMFTSIDATSELYPEGFSSWEDASDGESCISDKTELLASPVESSVVHNPDIFLSKPATVSVEDKVFGKTYKRERKSNPQFNTSFLTENRSTDIVAADPGSTTKNVKLKRKKVCYLQPEDFIQKINKKDEVEVCEEVKTIVERIPKVIKNPKDAVDGCGVDEGETIDRLDFFPVQENTAWEVDTEQGESGRKIIERLSNTHDQESNKANTMPRKKGKLKREHLNHTVQAFKLVNEEEFGKGQHSLVEGSSLQILSNQTELQIDSYPSSEEASKAKVEQRRVRRSRRLQLLAEETSKETKSICNSEKVQKVLENEGLLTLQRGCVTGLALVCTELQGSKDLTNCRGHWSDTNQNEKELDGVDKSLQNGCENFPVVKNGNDCLKTDRISESLHFSPAFHSQSQSSDVQKSISPIQVHTPTIEHPVQMGIDADPTEKSRLVEIGKDLLMGISCFPDKNLENSRTKELPAIRNALQEVNPETEDSELDTQYLLKTFKVAKRMSFILQPSSMPEPVTQNLTSGTSRQASGHPLKDDRERNREVSSSEDTQIETPEFAKFINPALEVVTVFKTASTKNCDTINPENSTEATLEHDLPNEKNNVSIMKNDFNVSENWEMYPRSMRSASTKTRNRRGLQKRRKTNICSTLPKIGLEDSNLNYKDGENSGELNKKSEQLLQRVDLSLSNDMNFSGETAETDKAEEKSKLLVLNSQPESTLLYATTGHLSPVAINCRASRSEISQGENEQVPNGGCQNVDTDGAQVNHITHTTSSQGSAAERFLEHPVALKNSGVLISSAGSATPDGLLSSSSEINKNTNCREDNMKSVVVRKLPEEGNLRKMQSSDSSGSQRLVKRCRWRAHKLECSEEGSSEDEDLPCFQRLFKQSLSTSPHSASQQVFTSEDVSKGEALFLTSCNHIAEESQKKQLESPSREEVHSVSPESVCSVNLFSSQSNGSEDFISGAEEPKAMAFGPRCPRSQYTNKTISQAEIEEMIVEQNEEVAAMETDHGEDQRVELNLGAGCGYESEASHAGDSSGFSSQSEILTTQQRDVMRSNLKKLEQEMAALEAVLEQHATQVSETPGAVNDLLECRLRGEVENETMSDKEKASFSTWDTQQKKQCIPADGGLATRDDFNKNSQDANNARSPTPPLTPLETQPKERKMPEVARLSIHLLKELKDSISQEDSSYPEKQHKGQERGNQSAACSLASGNTNKRDADDKLNSRNLHCSKGHPPAGDVSSAAKPSSCQPGDELTSPCIPRVASRNSSGESEQKMLTPTLMGVTGFKSPVVVTKRKLSLVASGLNQSELLLVQRFTRKTQSVFSNQITGGTTHVIMKTDAELVCERTLKYFLGIAGRKWVVSYQWIVQCFKEGKILNESDFEVRGDVINGRQHRGPRKARQATDRTLFMDFEICCSGPFTDMSIKHLEWMVELCGASVVKEPHLFTQKPTLTKLIVVQPDAAPEDRDYKAIQQQCGAVVVTREWVLDSVACYECQKFDTYLVFQS